jgi:hypothetical protein
MSGELGQSARGSNAHVLRVAPVRVNVVMPGVVDTPSAGSQAA